LALADDTRKVLAGRSAVVSGASRGIGRAIALELARCGARVHAVARDRAALESMASESQAIVAQVTDLTDRDSLQDLITRLRAEPQLCRAHERGRCCREAGRLVRDQL